MLDKILALKKGENSVKEFNEHIRQGIPSAVFGVPDAFKNYLVSTLDQKVLYVVKDPLTARVAVDAIKEIADKKAVYIPPKDEILMSSRAFSKDNLYQRLCALSEFDNADVIVATAETLMQTAPKNLSAVTLIKDQDCNQGDIVSTLVSIGYQRVETVSTQGTFSVRGDIIDVYAINQPNPVRIDFFGDNVETIKFYDVETRANLGYVDSVKIIQAVEFTFANDDINLFKTIIKNDLNSVSKDGKLRLKIIAGDLEADMENRNLDGLSILSPLSVDCATVFDLLPQDTVVIIDEAKRVKELADLNFTEFTERYHSLRVAGEVFTFAEKNFCSIDTLTERLKKYRLCALY